MNNNNNNNHANCEGIFKVEKSLDLQFYVNSSKTSLSIWNTTSDNEGAVFTKLQLQTFIKELQAIERSLVS